MIYSGKPSQPPFQTSLATAAEGPTKSSLLMSTPFKGLLGGKALRPRQKGSLPTCPKRLAIKHIRLIGHAIPVKTTVPLQLKSMDDL